MRSKNQIERQKILDLYAEGNTITEILQEVDYTFETVRNILVNAGVYKVRKKIFADGDLVAELAKQNKSHLEIAIELNISLIAVESILQKLRNKKYLYSGKTFDSQREMNDYKKRMGVEVIKLSEQGMSKDEIALKFGISKMSVVRFLDRNL